MTSSIVSLKNVCYEDLLNNICKYLQINKEHNTIPVRIDLRTMHLHLQLSMMNQSSQMALLKD